MRTFSVVVFLSFLGLITSSALRQAEKNEILDFESTTTESEATTAGIITTTTFLYTSPPPVGTTSAPDAAERECGCTRSKIWLDIIAVIDNSLSMTQEGISQIQATLDTVIHEMTLSPSGGWASRVGIISFNDDATVIAGLTTFSSTSDFENQLFAITASTSVKGVNILSGLQAALNLTQGVTPNPNRRTVVILFTSAYNNNGYEDPLPMARSLQSDNIKLITVAFAQRMESSEVNLVGELAYPGYSLNNTQPDLIDAIYDKLCQANCFCPGNWMQFRANYSDETSRGHGICLYYANIPSGWQPAKLACHGEATNSYLATEFTAEKHNFNVAYVQDKSQNGDYDYHIGLSYVNGAYVWEQPNGQPTIPLSGGYTSWNLHYPNEAAGTCVLNANVIGNIVGWTNEDCWSKTKLYLCQSNTCDTDNYCS